MVLDFARLNALLQIKGLANQVNAPQPVKAAIDQQLLEAVGAAPSAKLLTLVPSNDDEMPD